MSTLLTAEQLQSRFREVFGRPATVLAHAPGRVNLIGEHTDYNDGFVLPAAISARRASLIAPRDDGHVRLHALDLGRQTGLRSGGGRPFS